MQFRKISRHFALGGALSWAAFAGCSTVPDGTRSLDRGQIGAAAPHAGSRSTTTTPWMNVATPRTPANVATAPNRSMRHGDVVPAQALALLPPTEPTASAPLPVPQQSAPVRFPPAAHAPGWMAAYDDRIEDAAARAETPQVGADGGADGGAEGAAADELPTLPDDFVPWWDAAVKSRSAVARVPRAIAIEQLVENALRFSTYVSVVAVDPEIRKANITIEEAEFDWRTFLDATYRRSNDPVGNTLTTGNNSSRFLDDTSTGDVGFRRRNGYGGELRASQRFGMQDNNSRFLLPNPQGTSRLELQYTQPLLNGAGRCVNDSRIVLAQLDANLSHDETLEKLQDHLVRVTEAYWELYRARAEFFQRVKLLGAAVATLESLEGRELVDAVSRQTLRAKAAVTSRRSEIVRAQTAIRNAESKLRLLVNSPDLVNLGPHELTPAEMPSVSILPISMRDSLHTALLNRPDISQAIRQVRSAAVRQGVAENQVLPKLDLVASTYVAGLAGHHDFVSSTGKQFSEGGPGYSAGFIFEMPWGNRAALARQQQRQLEMNRALGKFRLTIEESLTTMEVAIRECETSYREMASRHQSMLAVDNEVNYLFQRWTTIPGVDDSAAFLLENLLDAQSRLTDEEAAMVRAQVGYAMSIVRLKREMGVLLRSDSPACSHDGPYAGPMGVPTAGPSGFPAIGAPGLPPAGPSGYGPAYSPNAPSFTPAQRPNGPNGPNSPYAPNDVDSFGPPTEASIGPRHSPSAPAMPRPAVATPPSRQAGLNRLPAVD